jgi:hypothetical protein
MGEYLITGAQPSDAKRAYGEQRDRSSHPHHGLRGRQTPVATADDIAATTTSPTLAPGCQPSSARSPNGHDRPSLIEKWVIDVPSKA